MSQLIVDKLLVNSGLRIPTYTTSQRDALSVSQGALIYNTDPEQGLQVWTGSEWVGLAGGAGLYDFLNVTFSNSRTDVFGQTLTQARQSMSGQGVDQWNTNTLYFNVDSDGVMSWTVPKTGSYRITAAGAKGGEGTAVNSSRPSGNGAVMRGEWNLEEGSVYNIIVGSKPNTSGEGGGGGGGTFMWDASTQNPLIIAGGGGGNGDVYQGTPSISTGQPGQMSTSGSSTGNGTGTGGTNGNGGSVDNTDGGPGGGGGFLTNGTTGSSGAEGGRAALNGGRGGNADGGSTSTNCGGYGGGGGESFNGVDAEGGGGGGGYSGGAGSGNDDPGGGGGGSFIATGVSNPATSTGSWNISGAEPHDVFSGGVDNIGAYNSGSGYLSISFLN